MGDRKVVVQLRESTLELIKKFDEATKKRRAILLEKNGGDLGDLLEAEDRKAFEAAVGVLLDVRDSNISGVV